MGDGKAAAFFKNVQDLGLIFQDDDAVCWYHKGEIIVDGMYSPPYEHIIIDGDIIVNGNLFSRFMDDQHAWDSHYNVSQFLRSDERQRIVERAEKIIRMFEADR
jgi:hypothetical protein